MGAQVGLFILGLTGLYFGAEWLVQGSSRLARSLGIKPVIIGLTIVALGTSSPELAVSLSAALKKSQGLAIGNVIGSNIANIGLILGLSALVSPLKVELSLLRRELLVMVAVAVVLFLMLFDLSIGFWEGLALFSGLLGYIGYYLYSAMKASRSEPPGAYGAALAPKGSGLKNGLRLIIGLALLIGGAQLMVRSGVFIARTLGVSEVTIGITLIAVGTSLPELATSIVSARRQASDICVGNVIGSNIFNTLFIIGFVAMVVPLTVDKGILRLELPVMLLFSVVVMPLMKTGFVLNRFEGAVLLLGYGVFISCLF